MARRTGTAAHERAAVRVRLARQQVENKALKVLRCRRAQRRALAELRAAASELRSELAVAPSSSHSAPASEGTAMQKKHPVTVSDPDFGIPADDRKAIAAALQASLADLVALALQLKQVHWNLAGPQFRAIHGQLDEIALAVRGHADDVAERMVTLGIAPDGRADTVAEHHRLVELPAGRIGALDAVKLLTGSIGRTIRAAREPLAKLGELDLVSQDLMVGVVADLEKHEWMLRSTVDR